MPANHLSLRTVAALWMATCCANFLDGQTSVLTWHNDAARTGQNLQEVLLTPGNVNSSSFGKLFTLPADGKVDAQPLYVPGVSFPGGTHNALYVVTEHDSAYAFDADTGSTLWHVSLLGPNESPSDDRGCFQVTPEIGATATPVIDPGSGPHGTMYLVAMSKDGSGRYHHRLHALDLATGVENFGGPTEVQASVPGSGTEGSGSAVTFDPKQHKDRAGLVLINGIVYTSWGSHCDFGPYTGWLIGYDASTLRQVSVLNMAPNGGEAAIWGSGAAPAVDPSGNLFISVANGRFDATLNSSGFPASSDFGNSFVKISTAGNSLAVTDYFTMTNTTAESDADLDLGSGGFMLIPPTQDSQGNLRSLAIGGGKDQTVYIVDQNNLGKYHMSMNADYQQISATAMFSTPAWFNGTLYFATSGSALKAFTLSNGAFTPTSQTASAFGYPGATPSISANGSSNGIVWAAENSSTAVLHAYDATDLSRELYNSNQAPNARDQFGQGNKFIVPTVVNGKVYVGTTSGVGAFGLLNSSSLPQPSPAADNSGSLLPGPIAPGELVTFKGASLGPASGAVFSVNPQTGMVDTNLAGTRVLFGETPAPILYSSATQVNAIVPYEVAGQSQVTAQLEYQGMRSSPFTLQVGPAAPGAFTLSATGSGQSATLNQDNSINGPNNPAPRGSTVSIYFTGGGQTSPPATTGSVTPAIQTQLVQKVSVTIGGVPQTFSFAGAVPTLVSGVSMINVVLADNTPTGPAEPILLTIGGIDSSTASTIAVK